MEELAAGIIVIYTWFEVITASRMSGLLIIA
jgi:hypothetical protein